MWSPGEDTAFCVCSAGSHWHFVVTQCLFGKTWGESVTFQNPAAAHSSLSFVSIRPRKRERRRAARRMWPVKHERLPGSTSTAFFDWQQSRNKEITCRLSLQSVARTQTQATFQSHLKMSFQWHVHDCVREKGSGFFNIYFNNVYNIWSLIHKS